MTGGGPRTDPRPMPRSGSVGPIPQRSPTSRRGAAERDELEPVRSWLVFLSRAIRAHRLYPPASAMRTQQMEAAVQGALGLLRQRESLVLGVREGEFLVDDQVVFTDDDPGHGPTHLLGAGSIFGLTLQLGLDPRELTELIAILAEDPGHQRRVGEELVTLLWRHHFRHVRYSHVDVLAASVVRRGGDEQASAESAETQRIRQDLADVVRRLAVDDATGHDLIASADRELDSPEACKRALDSRSYRLEKAITTFASSRAPGSLEAFRTELRRESAPEALALRLSQRVLEALRLEPRPTDPNPVLSSLLRLHRGMLEERAYEAARMLTLEVRRLGDEPVLVHDLELSSALLETMAEPALVALCVEHMDGSEDPRLAQRVGAYLRALGSAAWSGLIARFDSVERGGVRELLADLLLEVGEGRWAELPLLLERGRAEVGTQLLRAGQRLSPSDQAPLIAAALRTEHPEVRAAGTRLLLGYGPGAPDEALARLASDPDAKVRALAMRGLVTRPSSAGQRRLLQAIAQDSVLTKEPSELRQLLVATAVTAGEAAVEPLERLLTATTRLSAGLNNEAAEAVAAALSVVEGPAAAAILARAARSLNPKLRIAAKAALESGGRLERARLGLLHSGEVQIAALSERPAWPPEVRLEARAWGTSSGTPSSLPASLGAAPSGEAAASAPHSSPTATFAPRGRSGLTRLSTARAQPTSGAPRPQSGPSARAADASLQGPKAPAAPAPLSAAARPPPVSRPMAIDLPPASTPLGTAASTIEARPAPRSPEPGTPSSPAGATSHAQDAYAASLSRAARDSSAPAEPHAARGGLVREEPVSRRPDPRLAEEEFVLERHSFAEVRPVMPAPASSSRPATPPTRAPATPAGPPSAHLDLAADLALDWAAERSAWAATFQTEEPAPEPLPMTALTELPDLEPHPAAREPATGSAGSTPPHGRPAALAAEVALLTEDTPGEEPAPLLPDDALIFLPD
jgi:hypothetical protein